MDINYRKLKPSESLIYRALRLECLKNHPESFGSSYETQATLPQLAYEKFIKESNPQQFVVGAFDQEQLIGICAFAQEFKTKRTHEGTIIQVYVKSGYRGRQVGRHMLAYIIGKAFALPKIEQLNISVSTQNKNALKLYQQLGFEEFGVHKNYLKYGEQYFDVSFLQMRKTAYLSGSNR